MNLPPLSRISLFEYQRPWRQGIREGLLIHTLPQRGDGIWTELAPLPEWSQESLKQAASALLPLIDRLLAGKPPPPSSLPSVQFAMESLIQDLIDPITLPPLPYYLMASAESIDQTLLKEVNKIKIKVGHLTPGESLAHIKTISHLLTSPTLAFDMNRQWSSAQVIAFMEALPSLTIDYLEEPSPDPGSLPYPIALDESWREGIPPSSNTRAVIIKPTLGGWGASPPHIRRIFSSAYESEVGLSQIAKMAYRESVQVESLGISTYHAFEKSLFKGMRSDKGHISFPKRWSSPEEGIRKIGEKQN
ncbi:MAG: enolase C-terminal domain-like protein [Chlamydiota bacterium]|nr:enolase C-terminal domain-like protein [Chlamydiota bacterium]